MAKGLNSHDSSASKIRVLLADDHTVIRDGLRMILEAEGDIQVLGGAADGWEAIRLARRFFPDVVVMDITMPELNGIEATRQIREKCPDVQVVILSIHATSEYIYQALKAGARGYLLKESAGREVVAAVRSVHAGQRYLSVKIAETVFEDYMRRGETLPSVSPLDRLSDRERQVLQGVVEGKSNLEIAGQLNLSPKTVETYRSRLMHKLEISDLPSLVRFAIDHGLTPP